MPGQAITMLQTRLDQITEQDVNRFVADTRLPESAVLDYKRDFDLSSSKGKKAFLADVCAFANNGGGHIIVGVDELRDEGEEKTGLPVAPPRGAKAFNKSVAEDVVHASIEPRIGSFVEIQPVPGQWGDGPIYVVRVQRTWNPPHCVTSGDQRTYYRRSGTKSEPMTTDQIRDAFVGAADLGERIARFHLDRVQRVVDGGTTFPLSDNAESRGRTIVHVVPLSYFASGDRLALDNVPTLKPSRRCSGWDPPIPNFDGKIAYAGKPVADSHIQLFRNGVVELVDTGIVAEWKGEQALNPNHVESEVLHALEQASTFFESQAELHAPYAMHLTLVDVKGSVIPATEMRDTRHAHPIELDRLSFPDLRIDDVTGDLPTLLRPLFDILWQAGGRNRSFNYDPETGEYKNGWMR